MNTEEVWTWADWVYKENYDSSFVSFTEKEPFVVTGRIGFFWRSIYFHIDLIYLQVQYFRPIFSNTVI